MLPMAFTEKLFDDMFGDTFTMVPAFNNTDPIFGKKAKNLMKTDVRELDKTFELDIDLPGFKKNEVSIEFDNGYLTIKAAKKSDQDAQNAQGKYIRRERYSGECSRSFYIGEDIEPTDIAAKFEDGILKISFPKMIEHKEPEKKQISIA